MHKGDTMIKVKIVGIFVGNNKSPVVVLEEIDSEPKRKLAITSTEMLMLLKI